MNKKNDRIVLRLIQSTKPIAWWLALGAVLDILAVVSAVAAPDLLGELVQKLYDFWEKGCQGTIRHVILPGLAMLLAAYAANGLFSYLNMRLMNQVVSKYYSCGLRIQISEKIKKLPVRYVDQTPVGDILRKMTGDVSEMGGYIHQIFDIMIKGGLQILLITAMMFIEDWRLACFVVLLTPLSLILSSKIAGISEKYFDRMFEKSGNLTELVEEAFSNYPTTKAYNLEEYTEEKHRKINESLRSETVRATFTSSVVQPLIRLSNAISYILINLLGGWLMVSRGVSVGVVVTIILYARLFASPLEQIAYGFSQLNRVKAAARRVYEILDMEEEQEEVTSMDATPQGAVTFDHVDFDYVSEQPLIRGLSLQVQPGQKVAIVGPTGAGKTTIVNLLMRFYDPIQGNIYLDGVDIGSCSRASVRSCFGMVLQDTWLFRGTIYENLAYGRPEATKEEIEEACRQTYCDHFIRTMPQGYETVIGEDRTNLSGGQKQLLTIARALLADSPLLILDEATSNVDTRTEVLIQKAMDTLMKGKTCFVIAHRLSTILDADLILVLDHGRIVEQGTHHALLASKGFYYQLYQSQYAI